ncbi:MAG: hypothetical protein EKK53_15395 [Burkholderiales bacterium]|nr:MAG: hypothetical protein EKK53_15395 [Burkholderiales bacterium]
MLHRFLAAVAISVLACAPALAQEGPKRCIVNWPWQIPTSQERTTQYTHKALHAAGSAAVTMVVSKATDSVEWGIAAGIAVGAVREVYKYRHQGMTCEISSMAFDAAGIAIGAGVAQRWLVVPQRDGVQVAYVARF